MPGALDHVARQCRLAVVADHLSPESCSVSRWGWNLPEATLGALLDHLRRERHLRGGIFSWGFQGEYLILTDRGPGLDDERARDWLQQNYPVAMNLLEDFGEAIAGALMALASGGH